MASFFGNYLNRDPYAQGFEWAAAEILKSSPEEVRRIIRSIESTGDPDTSLFDKGAVAACLKFATSYLDPEKP